MNKEEFQTKKNDIDSKIRELKNQKIQLEKEYIESNQVFPIGSKVCITVMDHERILVPEVKKLAYIVYKGTNDGEEWDSYEEALEAGLQEALKLI